MKFILNENFDNYDFEEDIIDFLCDKVTVDELKQYVDEFYTHEHLVNLLSKLYPASTNVFKSESYFELLDDYITNVALYEDEDAIEYFKEVYADEIEEELKGIIDNGGPEYDTEGRRIY